MRHLSEKKSRRVSVKEAAELLGLTREGVRARLKRGALEGGHDENGKVWVAVEADAVAGSSKGDANTAVGAAAPAITNEEPGVPVFDPDKLMGTLDLLSSRLARIESLIEAAPKNEPAMEDLTGRTSAAFYGTAVGANENRPLEESGEVAAALDRLSERVGSIETLLESVPDDVLGFALGVMRDERDELRIKLESQEQLLDIALRDHSMKLAELKAEIARQSQARPGYGGGLIDDLIRLNAAVNRLRGSAPRYCASVSRAWATFRQAARRVMRLG